MTTKVIIIDYQDLINSSSDISKDILEAYGQDGLGVIAIRGVPNWEELVRDTIPLAHRLQALPQEVLDSLEHAPSLYNAGWSFGKEKLGDKPDTKKASFYFNPLNDDPKPETRDSQPWALPANLWPKDHLPELEVECKKLGKTMHSVVVALAQHIDKMQLGTSIAEEMQVSLKAKSRLLYYYALNESDMEEARSKPDGWIGWHNDSGFLTGLTPDYYFKHSTGEIVANPEPETAGLWVAARDGVLHRISIPRDCMAVQCGECMQVITGGRLVATPHCVRPPLNTTDVSRACMPIFVDSSLNFPLKSPNGREAVFLNTVKQWVPPLSDRWTDGQTFGDFLGTTFKAYYEWATKA
jgi:isopenicillin N synthase-like dioxygenase